MAHTLLLVDDDIPFATVVKTSLEKEGYEVLYANHANEARVILDRFHDKIEVMLLDWSMPDITGIDFLRTIKREKNFEDIQVIMQTVMGGSENIQQGIEAGAFFYLVKPVKKELLISTIRAAILSYERKKDLLKQLEESERAFNYLTEGVFQFKTVAEGDYLAIRIANECPNPQEAVLISELFANAVEHGNLDLSYDEKTRLIGENRLNEEIERLLSLAENRDKFVQVNFRKLPDRIVLIVEDMGRGFDFEKYLRLDDNRVFHNHGRGIALINAVYPLRYIGRGNKVVVEIPLLKNEAQDSAYAKELEAKVEELEKKLTRVNRVAWEVQEEMRDLKEALGKATAPFWMSTQIKEELKEELDSSAHKISSISSKDKD